MFKKLRKDLKALSEEVELSASTGQEVDLDELNEDEEVDAAEVETEKELTGEETLEEMISFLEDEVIEMGAEDAERLMTEDDDEDEEEKEDSKEDEEESEEVDKELQEMIAFLEDDEAEVEVEGPTDEEIKEKEEKAEQAVAEALNAVRALRKAKKARR